MFKIITSQNVYTLEVGMILRLRFAGLKEHSADFKITQKCVVNGSKPELHLIGKSINGGGFQKFIIPCDNPNKQYLPFRLYFQPTLKHKINKLLKL